MDMRRELDRILLRYGQVYEVAATDQTRALVVQLLNLLLGGEDVGEYIRYAMNKHMADLELPGAGPLAEAIINLKEVKRMREEMEREIGEMLGLDTKHFSRGDGLHEIDEMGGNKVFESAITMGEEESESWEQMIAALRSHQDYLGDQTTAQYNIYVTDGHTAYMQIQILRDGGAFTVVA